jgi:hypothetical protein
VVVGGELIGGADRDRTDDPLLAKQMLSQLSYSPGGAAVSGGMENWGLRIEKDGEAFLNTPCSIAPFTDGEPW